MGKEKRLNKQQRYKCVAYQLLLFLVSLTTRVYRLGYSFLILQTIFNSVWQLKQFSNHTWNIRNCIQKWRIHEHESKSRKWKML